MSVSAATVGHSVRRSGFFQMTRTGGITLDYGYPALVPVKPSTGPSFDQLWSILSGNGAFPPHTCPVILPIWCMY